MHRWVVDMDARSVTVHRSQRVRQVLAGDEVLEGEDVVPGFSVRISEIFEGEDLHSE